MEEDTKKLDKNQVPVEDEKKEILDKEDKERVAFLLKEYGGTLTKLYEFDKKREKS